MCSENGHECREEGGWETGCSCGCDGHGHDRDSRSDSESRTHAGPHGGNGHSGAVARIAVSAVLFAAGMVLGAAVQIHDGWPHSVAGWTRFALMAVSFVVSGGGVVLSALRNILRGRVFDENFLMTIASVGAFAIGEYPEAAAVMLFYQVGEFFQDYAVGKSRRSIESLMELRPDSARLVTGSAVSVVPAESVAPGSVIEVTSGERIPLDGVVVVGSAFLDTSALTGESVPRKASEGDEVLGGCINTNGVLRIRTTRAAGESAIARVMELVGKAGSRKSVSERFITRFAKVYTPVVTAAAFLLAVVPPLALGGGWGGWLRRALVFLVVSCPCALVVSVPLGFFAGIGAASRKGILIKGSGFLESLADVRTAVFDKTGTLTHGEFTVTAVHPAEGGTLGADELVAVAAHAEKYSSHPISVSLRNAHVRAVCGDCGTGSCDCCERAELVDVEEVSGQGIKGILDGRQVLAGNARLMKSRQVEGFAPEASPGNVPPEDCAAKDGGTVVHVAVGGTYAGHIVISDRVRADAAEALSRLRVLGVRRTVMLTGDTASAAERIAGQLGVDAFYSDLMPGDKVSQVERLLSALGTGKSRRRNRLLFVGDGINDAPVLARSDIGLAMGAMGSDAAIETADVVLMTDELLQIPEALRIARRTRRAVAQNIVLALGVKAAVLLLGAAGFASMWAAVFADVGVSCLAVVNSMRLLWTRRKKRP